MEIPVCHIRNAGQMLPWLISRYGLRELRLELVGGIALEYSRLRLHHLGEGGIRERFAVRQRAAVPPVRERRVALSFGVQLRDESALADAGNAHDRHQLRRLVVAHALEGPQEQLTLPCDSFRDAVGRGQRMATTGLLVAREQRLLVGLE